jgi:hypothetical protein
MSITFDQMKIELTKFKVPSIDAMAGKLNEIGTAAVVCAAIAKAHPNDYKERLRASSDNTHWLLPTTQSSETSSVSSTIAHLINDQLFPVDEFWLDDEQMDYRTDAAIYLGLHQYRITYDEFTEMVSTDPRELSEYAGFPLLICMLAGWLDEDFDRYWKMYNQRFRWGIRNPPNLPGRDYYLSVRVFKRELRQRGIGPLFSMFLAIDGSTGNVFFDFDYEMDMPPTVTPRTLDHLHREWKRSRPIENECDQAYDLIMNEPQIYVKFLDAYQASLRKRKGR